MTDYLKSVISSLYRPPRTGHQVFALSRAEAMALPAIDGVAMISVTAPEKSIAQVADFKFLLRLSFADVDFNNKELSPRARLKLKHAFTVAQANDVLHFIHALPSATHTLVVHCEGGRSRSCAIAMFLHKHYGYAADSARLVAYNLSVFSTLEDI